MQPHKKARIHEEEKKNIYPILSDQIHVQLRQICLLLLTKALPISQW